MIKNAEKAVDDMREARSGRVSGWGRELPRSLLMHGLTSTTTSTLPVCPGILPSPPPPLNI